MPMRKIGVLKRRPLNEMCKGLAILLISIFLGVMAPDPFWKASLDALGIFTDGIPVRLGLELGVDKGHFLGAADTLEAQEVVDFRGEAGVLFPACVGSYLNNMHIGVLGRRRYAQYYIIFLGFVAGVFASGRRFAKRRFASFPR